MTVPRPAPSGKTFLSLTAITFAAVLFLACGGGGGDSSSTPTTTPQPSPAAVQSPTVTVPTASCTVDVGDDTADWTVFGAEAGDFLADRFSLVSGDFDGDGLDDLLIGAPLADGPSNSRNNGGEAYVIFAADAGGITDLAETEAGLTIYGEASSDNLGFTVASGDVNGDGIDDVLVGARFASSGDKSGAGKAYVIYGGPGLGGVVDTAAGQEDATIVGRDSGDFLGIALGAGDVNGDGFDDLILGAAGGDGPAGDRQEAGEVHVVLGASDLPATSDLAVTDPAFSVYGATAKDSLPNHLSAADLDGDGRAELILGNPFADGADGQEKAGRAYIVPVPAEGASVDLASGEGFTVIYGASSRDGLGFYTASGDVNGDGRQDALLGARDADGPGDTRNNAGEVHILFGRPELPSSFDLRNETLDVVIYGIDPGDSLGFTVAASDLNADGIDDILAGAPIGDSCENSRTDGGEVYGVAGSESLGPEIDLAEGLADLSLFGPEEGDELGFSLTTGDFNGDGRADVAMGALLADGPENDREDSGQAFVILTAQE